MILVTGGAGFIGSHTVVALETQGARVRVLDDLSTGRRENLEGTGAELLVGSITDPETVRQAMQDVTHVVHLAARISVPESCADPVGYHAVNGGGFVTVAQAARAAGVQRLVYATSCAVYGSLPGLPKREVDPVAPESPYASSKLANEAFASSFTALGLGCVGLRYFNVFGPRQDPGGPYGAVIPRFVERALRGEALTIFGDGEQGRDFVSVKDVARANVAGLQGKPGVYNIGTGRMLTVNALAARVRSIVGDVAVHHLGEREGDVRLSCADVGAARVGLGWSASEVFEDALDETIRWFRRG